jgi:hypothetical protein
MGTMMGEIPSSFEEGKIKVGQFFSMHVIFPSRLQRNNVKIEEVPR